MTYLPIAVLLLLAAAALAVGRRILGKVEGLPPALVLGWSGALGTASLAWTGFLLGILGALRPLPVLVLLILLLFLGRTWMRALGSELVALHRAWRPRSLAARVLSLWAVAVLVLALVGALAPPRYNDALLYHVPLARRFASAGRLVPVSVLEIRQAAFPLAGETLAALGMTLGGDSMPAAIELLNGLFLLLLVMGEAEAAAGRRLAWVAPVAILASPVFDFLLQAANVELVLMLMLFGSLSLLGHRRLLAAGLLAGTATAVKPALGLLALLIGGGRLALRVVTGGAGAAVRALASFVVPAFLLALAWPLWRWATTGNPLYPLIWGGDDVSLEVLARLEPMLAQGRWSILDLVTGRVTQRTAHGIAFANGPLLLALAPLAWLDGGGGEPARRLRSAALICLLVVLAVLADDRFLLLPALCLTPSLALAWGHLEARGGAVRAAALAVLVVGVGWALLSSLKAQVSNVPYALGLESRRSYLTRWFADYDLVEAANLAVPPGSRVLRLCRLDSLNDYHQGETVDLISLAFTYGQVRETAASMCAILAGREVSHVIDCGNLDALFVSPAEAARFRLRLAPVFQGRGKILHALRREPTP